MSFISSDEHSRHVHPDEPLSAAPRPLRLESDLTPNAKQARSDGLRRSRFDEMREEAFARSNRHPLEFQLARERSRLLPAVLGGIAAALGVSVVAALVFFNVLPNLKSDPTLAVSISTPASATAATTPTDAEVLLQGFVRFQQSEGQDSLGHARSEPDSAGAAKAPEKSQALLEKFIQWQQRTR